LEGANLRGADLTGADLTRANLTGATYGEGIEIGQKPKQFLGLKYPVFFFKTHVKIGCEIHSLEEWEDFSDDEISDMDTVALQWWNRKKRYVIAMGKDHMEDQK
jgi:uncharacterized protein YjbI with pentapeptide repeats